MIPVTDAAPVALVGPFHRHHTAVGTNHTMEHTRPEFQISELIPTHTTCTGTTLDAASLAASPTQEPVEITPPMSPNRLTRGSRSFISRRTRSSSSTIDGKNKGSLKFPNTRYSVLNESCQHVPLDRKQNLFYHPSADRKLKPTLAGRQPDPSVPAPSVQGKSSRSRLNTTSGPSYNPSCSSPPNSPPCRAVKLPAPLVTDPITLRAEEMLSSGRSLHDNIERNYTASSAMIIPSQSHGENATPSLSPNSSDNCETSDDDFALTCMNMRSSFLEMFSASIQPSSRSSSSSSPAPAPKRETPPSFSNADTATSPNSNTRTIRTSRTSEIRKRDRSRSHSRTRNFVVAVEKSCGDHSMLTLPIRKPSLSSTNRPGVKRSKSFSCTRISTDKPFSRLKSIDRSFSVDSWGRNRGPEQRGRSISRSPSPHLHDAAKLCRHVQLKPLEAAQVTSAKLILPKDAVSNELISLNADPVGLSNDLQELSSQDNIAEVPEEWDNVSIFSTNSPEKLCVLARSALEVKANQSCAHVSVKDNPIDGCRDSTYNAIIHVASLPSSPRILPNSSHSIFGYRSISASPSTSKLPIDDDLLYKTARSKSWPRKSVAFSAQLEDVRSFSKDHPSVAVNPDSHFAFITLANFNCRQQYPLPNRDIAEMTEWLKMMRDIYPTVERQCVVLETVNVEGFPTLRGTVLVRNIAFDKKVFVRITFDNWATFQDVEALFESSECVPESVLRNNADPLWNSLCDESRDRSFNDGVLSPSSSSQSSASSPTGSRFSSSSNLGCFSSARIIQLDRFAWSVDVPPSYFDLHRDLTMWYARIPIFLAVRYNVADQEFWDNFNGSNYSFRLARELKIASLRKHPGESVRPFSHYIDPHYHSQNSSSLTPPFQSVKSEGLLPRHQRSVSSSAGLGCLGSRLLDCDDSSEDERQFSPAIVHSHRQVQVLRNPFNHRHNTLSRPIDSLVLSPYGPRDSKNGNISNSSVVDLGMNASDNNISAPHGLAPKVFLMR